MSDFYQSFAPPGNSPRDPLELGGKGGALFVPTHGLESSEDDISVAGLRFVRLNFYQWDMIEKLWVRDVYGDFFRARPKFYCLFAFDVDEGMPPANIQELTKPFLDEFERFVLAARIVQPDVLVNAHRIAHVARIGMQNFRTVGLGRFRLYTTAFGEPMVLPAKSRKFGEREELLPPRVIQPIGRAYTIGEETIAGIEQTLALYKNCLALGADMAIGVVLRNFTVGHDIFLHRRQRMLCLIRAHEACFGPFNRPQKKPVLGRRIAKAFELFRSSRADIEMLVEGNLRAVRNALAHGGDGRQPLDFAAAEVLLSDALRVGLRPLLRLALQNTKAGPFSQTPEASPMDVLQQLLDSAEAGNNEAVDRLLQA